MASSRETLLLRYLEAAKTIAQSSVAETTAIQPSLPRRGSRGKISRDKRPPCPSQDDFDPTMRDMAELLSRQAQTLVKLHEALARRAKGHDEADEELFVRRIKDLMSIATSKFYAYRYDLLPVFWRQLYTDTLILETHLHLLRPLIQTMTLPEEVLDLVVEKLDKALITAGGAGKQLGSRWIEGTLQLLEECWQASQTEDQDPRPGASYSLEEPFGRPCMSRHTECPRYSGWTMERFEDYMKMDGGAPWPIVFTDLMGSWPALTDRPWKDPNYLLSRTFGGRRLVPVEVGRSYVDEGWGQELIQFKDFLGRYVDTAQHTEGDATPPVGYLAQHNLFQQIPSLRNDIQVPDFCWVDVPPHPTDPAKNQPTVSIPQLNAWFGPARTITPLHTDGYHNLLCQVVGTKYLRLYPPWATTQMRPRAPEHGVDMSNTSELDVGVLEGWDPLPDGLTEHHVREMRGRLDAIEFRECVLGPGDTLVIPIGWWHYVRSLSVSFSVSFWWN